jgi:cell division septal protein FtsQ
VENHPYIETALVSRIFPSALKIDIKERVPVAFISASKLYAIDHHGVLLPKKIEIAGFPIITGIKNFKEQPGKRIESEHIDGAIKLIELIKNSNPILFENLSEVSYDHKKGFLVYFNDARFPAYFGFDKFYAKAQKLQAFFQQIKEENRYQKLKYIDLRYQEQVVAKF